MTAGGRSGSRAGDGPVSVVAPAKLTLTLRITGIRADGFHEIEAEMVTLDLADVLSIDPDGDGVTVGGPFADGVPGDDGNLVAGALRIAGRRAGVHVDKRIPHGGGLGGGSADAAAVLRWAGFDDLTAASRLGADIPFCLVGGRAFVRGIGEVVETTWFQHLEVTLVVPPLHVATPEVYRAWDALGGPRADGPNDLEPAAIGVEPALADWRDRIEELSGVVPVLAGSGSAWFVPGRRDDSLAPLRAEGAAVIATRTVPADDR